MSSALIDPLITGTELVDLDAHLHVGIHDWPGAQQLGMQCGRCVCLSLTHSLSSRRVERSVTDKKGWWELGGEGVKMERGSGSGQTASDDQR